MSDQLVDPTPVDLLVDRLSQRVGQLTVENEWLKVQIGLLQEQTAEEPSHDAPIVI
jgi:hypothetical protein